MPSFLTAPFLRHLPARVSPEMGAVVYMIAAGAWILLSDWVVESWPASDILQTSKGLLFVGVTGAILYIVLRIGQQRQAWLRAQLDDALTKTNDGVWTWSLVGDSMQVTSGGDSDVGWEAAGSIHDLASWQSITHPDDWPDVVRQMEKLDAGDDRFVADYRIRTAGGDWIWYRSKGYVTERDADGQPLTVVGTYYNINELVESERAAERTSRALAILLAINHAIDRSPAPDEMAQGICDAVAETGGVPLVRLRRVTGGDAAETVAEAGDAAAIVPDIGDLLDRRTAGNVLLPGVMAPDWLRTVGDLRDTAKDDHARAVINGHGLRSLIVLPVHLENGPDHLLEIVADTVNAFGDRDAEIFDTLGQDIGFALNALDLRERYERAEIDLAAFADRVERALHGSVAALARVVETRDPYTAGHQLGVAKLAGEIAAEMGFPPDKIEGIRIGASMHDIGKIGIPTEILSKPGRLDDSEIALIQRHATIGHEIVREIDFGWPVDLIVHQHHERFDGSGYPQGLVGEAIAIEARIVAVADVIESMATDRPYRKSHTLQAVMEEIESGRGTRYDPAVVDAAMTVTRDYDSLSDLLAAKSRAFIDDHIAG